jgi:hypothetical protein
MAFRTTMAAIPQPTAPVAQGAACLNCGAPTAGTYCGDCGQAARTARLSFPRLLREAAGGILSFDSATVRTLRGLISRPGGFVRDYLLGRRVGYLGPLRYYLLVIALNVGASALLQHPSATATPAEPERSFWDQNLVQLQIGVAFALLMLPLAVAQRMLHRRSGYHLAEHYAFNLYVLAQSVVVVLSARIVLWAAGRVLRGDPEGLLWLAVFVCYLLWAGRDFYREPLWRVGLKVAGALAAALAFLGVVGLLLQACGIVG